MVVTTLSEQELNKRYEEEQTIGCSLLTNLLIEICWFQCEFPSDQCKVLQSLLLLRFPSKCDTIGYSGAVWGVLLVEENPEDKNCILVFFYSDIHVPRLRFATSGVTFCNHYSSFNFYPNAKPLGILKQSKVFYWWKKIQRTKITFWSFLDSNVTPRNLINPLEFDRF